jgi:hypothetical protein
LCSYFFLFDWSPYWWPHEREQSARP